VSGGLGRLGLEVVGVSAELAGALEGLVKNLIAVAKLPTTHGADTLKDRVRAARAAARATPLLGRAHGLSAVSRLRKVGRVDGVVQIGTGFVLPAGTRYVTFEDLTVAQALRLSYPEFESLGRKAVQTRLERQRRAYQGAVACCMTTRWAGDSVVNDYGIPAGKVHAVGVGRNHAVGATSRDWQTPRYLFVGVEWERKNGPAVLRAFTRVREHFPDARLDVVGGHPPLDTDGVVGHGFLSLGEPAARAEVEALFREATCFVMPSLYEPSALAYVEAGAAGLPSIGTTVGGSAELIGDGGCVVDPHDDEALFTAMRELADPETAARLGGLAHRRSELYTWDSVAQRILRALAPVGVDRDALAAFL
jgi:Glycosyl transferases group 1